MHKILRRTKNVGGSLTVETLGLEQESFVLTNVGVEDLLVAPLTLLKLQLHLDVLPACQQNHVLVVGLLQSGQGHV